MNEVALAALFAVLVVVLFVLALMEASLLHLRRSAVVADAASGDRSARRLLELLGDLPRVMNAILLAVLLSQVTATAIAGLLAARPVRGRWRHDRHGGGHRGAVHLRRGHPQDRGDPKAPALIPGGWLR
ncbi:MAG: CNNM domain-containing protein [Microthrixaceae bacterium]